MRIVPVFAVSLIMLLPSLQVCNMPARIQIPLTEMHFSFVSDLAWSPEGDQLAIVSFPDIYLVDASSWTIGLIIRNGGVSHVAWNTSGSQLAGSAGGNPSTVRIISSESGLEVDRMSRSFDAVSEDVVLPMYLVNWSPNERFIATDSFATELLVWNLMSREVRIVGTHEFGRVSSLDWSSQSDQIVTCGGDGAVRIWDLLHHENSVIADGRACASVDWHPAADQILATLTGNETVVLDANSGRELLSIPHEFDASIAQWNHSGDLIAIGGREGSVIVYDTAIEEYLSTMCLNSKTITDLTWSPAANLLAVADFNGTVTVWQIG